MRIYFLLFLALLTNYISFGQLQIKKPKDIESAILENFLSDDIQISNISFKGDKKAIGVFSNGEEINMNKGILICTGQAKDAQGSNKSTGTGTANKTDGDDYLSKHSESETFDAAIIEFDFIPYNDYISFNFVFASEEYPEFSNSLYNDIFVFALTNEKGKTKNLAVIPNTNSPVAVNKVNHEQNAEYYINNAHLLAEPKIVSVDTNTIIKNGKKITLLITYNIEAAIIDHPTHNLEYDGFTKVIQASAKVKPLQKYHLKIAIADATDQILDSGVFIEYGSFKSHKTPEFKYGVLAKENGYYFKIDTLSVTDIEPDPPITEEDSVPNIPLTTLFFNKDDHKLTYYAKNKLKLTWNRIKDHDNVFVIISGYADASGPAYYNQDLSEKRALEVEKYLKKLGLKNNRIFKVTGYGETNFIGDNKTSQGRKRNRRVEIEFKVIDE